MEVYLAGRLVVGVLCLSERQTTPLLFLEKLRQVPTIDLGGFKLGYGPRDNQGSDRVYLTVIDGDGNVRPVLKMVRK